eukprot:c10687_g1_i1.p1 GENE.c10687_g1_i1~~c10687_g1_i1.p1  ORF type:complete len:512 (+),score=98.73 c10687_g1_i1:64-1536(+)
MRGHLIQNISHSNYSRDESDEECQLIRLEGGVRGFIADNSIPNWIEFSSASSGFFASNLSYFFALIGSVANVGIIVLVFFLNILLWVIPLTVQNWIVEKLFRVGYRLYLTQKIGGYIHSLTVNSAHSSHIYVNAHTPIITPIHLSSCTVWPIPIIHDNYAYLICDNETGHAAAVDPSAPDVVMNVVHRLGMRLTTVVCTHSHHDHAGGNSKIKKRMPSVTIVGASGTSMMSVDSVVQDGDVVWVGKTCLHVITTPCHTLDHVVYVVGGVVDQGIGLAFGEAAFTGDTLFTGGVGALFHGSEHDLAQSLKKLNTLPDSCRVFCGHEYAEHLLWFAVWLEPTNQYVLKRAHWAHIQKTCGRPTVPSTMGWERRTNPWLRTHDERLISAVNYRLGDYLKMSWWRREWGRSVPLSWVVPLDYRSRTVPVSDHPFDQSNDAAIIKRLGRLQKLFNRLLGFSGMLSLTDTSSRHFERVEGLIVSKRHMYMCTQPPS